jgi:hypothetical protein
MFTSRLQNSEKIYNINEANLSKMQQISDIRNKNFSLENLREV